MPNRSIYLSDALDLRLSNFAAKEGTTLGKLAAALVSEALDTRERQEAASEAFGRKVAEFVQSAPGSMIGKIAESCFPGEPRRITLATSITSTLCARGVLRMEGPYYYPAANAPAS